MITLSQGACAVSGSVQSFAMKEGTTARSVVMRRMLAVFAEWFNSLSSPARSAGEALTLAQAGGDGGGPFRHATSSRATSPATAGEENTWSYFAGSGAGLSDSVRR